jgi:uncharacterized FlaG/YvyC family protein
MEAYMAIQPTPANVNSKNSPQRAASSPTSAAPAARPAAPAPALAPPLAPAPSFDRANISANGNLLSAHQSVSPQNVEDLVTFSIPFNDGEISDASISRQMDEINEALAPSSFRLNLDVHDATNLVMVQVVDTNTEEVLRELPPESRLDIMARIQEFTGLLFNTTS